MRELRGREGPRPCSWLPALGWLRGRTGNRCDFRERHVGAQDLRERRAAELSFDFRERAVHASVQAAQLGVRRVARRATLDAPDRLDGDPAEVTAALQQHIAVRMKDEPEAAFAGIA